MRRISKILTAGMFLGVIVLTMLTGCNNQNDSQTANTKDDTVSVETEEAAADISDSLELLNTVWATYAEEDKFSAAGGDYSEENSVTDAPGNFGLSDADTLDSVLGLPADCVPMIDNAASLMHMMNANTFTCGAFHAADAKNVSVVAEKLKTNIMERQWMCGFPDKLLIVTVGNYVVSAFGNEELIDTFRDRLLECYQTAEIVCEAAIE